MKEMKKRSKNLSEKKKIRGFFNYQSGMCDELRNSETRRK